MTEASIDRVADALSERDEAYMRLAIDEAQKAEALGEVPVGCVIVQGDSIVGRGHNRRERIQDPTAHAELLAVRDAALRLSSWRLLDTTVYVTLEPCPMCAGALVHARVARVVYGCADPKAGALRTLYRLGEDTRLNHRYEVRPDVLATECSGLLTDFFARIRANRRPRSSRT